MEYTRRTRSKKRGSSGGGRAFIALLLIAAIVYLISASAAGTWIAENVVAPVFSAFSSTGSDPVQSAQTDPGESDPGAASLSLSSGAGAQSRDVQLSGMSCFALQMGVYSQQSNAAAQSAALRTKGAAGYIIEEAGRYRVLASAYADEASAREVKTRLTDEGLDCALYAMAANGATLRITAAPEQLDAIEHAFSALSDAQRQLGEAAMNFDAGSQSVAEGRAAAQLIYDSLSSAKAGFSAYAAGNTMLSSLLACYESCMEAMQALLSPASESIVDFSSNMKYTHLYITDKYAALMGSISG